MAIRKPRRALHLRDPLRYERDHWSEGVEHVAGVDEVGRGPLAGPVVAAAVILPPDVHLEKVRDSKALTAPAREALAPVIRDAAVAWALGAASAREIDENGIVWATREALRRCLAALAFEPGHVVVDGRPVSGLGWTHAAVPKADHRVHCVACASILAKVCRDRLMIRLHHRYPEYGWASNKGYGTAEHLAALVREGPSPHHRRSFAGVATGPRDPSDRA